MPIAGAIILLLAIIILSYRQTIRAYPNGGGAYIVARDGFLPRQLSLLGDRLVFSNGVILLSLCAIVLVVLFRGDTTAIIPLYAVGVFTSFTLSQTGMVRYWFREKTQGWQGSALLNGIGALVTIVVLLIIAATKFLLGAWAVLVAVPLLVSLFLAIRRHYLSVSEQLTLQAIQPRSYLPRPKVACASHPVIVVGALHRGTMEALDYARAIGNDIMLFKRGRVVTSVRYFLQPNV
jgi:amino acid transporter